MHVDNEGNFILGKQWQSKISNDIYELTNEENNQITIVNEQESLTIDVHKFVNEYAQKG